MSLLSSLPSPPLLPGLRTIAIHRAVRARLFPIALDLLPSALVAGASNAAALLERRGGAGQGGGVGRGVVVHRVPLGRCGVVVVVVVVRGGGNGAAARGGGGGDGGVGVGHCGEVWGRICCGDGR